MENVQSTSSGSFQQRFVSYLKEWPNLAVRLFKSPETEIPLLPTQGSYERPLVYAGTAGLIAGLWSFFILIRFSPGMAFSAIIAQTLTAMIALFVAGFVFNLILSIFGKDPGLYRTIQLVSIAIVVSPIVIVLQSFVPILAYAPMLLWGYVIYKYARVASNWTQKQAGIMVAVLLLLPLLSMTGLFFGTRYLLMGSR